MRRSRFSLVCVLAFAAPFCFAARAVAAPSEPLPGSAAPLSERVGPEIDGDERARFGLFPDLPRFQGGHFEATPGGYRLVYMEDAEGRARSRRRSIRREAFQQTAWHVAFVEECDRVVTGAALDSGASGGNRADSTLAGTATEPDLLRRLALRYAARRQYDLARVLIADLRDTHAATPAGAWASEAAPRIDALAGPRRALIWNGTLLDQRGRTDLIVFSGYYGLWLGIAIPAAFESEDAQSYAAGLLGAPALSAAIAVASTKNSSITRGQATIISLGGHFGTWQGLGWSGTTDAEGHEVLAAGVAGGLAGILLAIPISNAVGFGEGHAQVANSAMYWGGWFGLVESVLTGRDQTDENRPLVDMLVGSDVGLLAGAIGGRNARLSTGRMRLINLCGVLGTAFGGGMALLTETQDEGAMLLLGGGSVAGLVLGCHWTRAYDRGKDLASTTSPSRDVQPVLSMRPAGPGRSLVPAAGVRVRF